MISDLRELIAPLDEADFIALLKARELRLVRRPGDERFRELIDWQSLRRLIECDAFVPEQLRFSWKRQMLAADFYRRDNKVDAGKVASLLERGASIIANRLENYVPAIGRLAASISARLGDQVQMVGIVTTGGDGALPAHYDPGDLIVVQIEGTKRWQIYGAPTAYPLAPARDGATPDGPVVFDEVLQPGDLLFVPSGFWHRCENGPALSLHVAITLKAPTGWHAAQRLLRDALADEMFRRPLTRLDDAGRAAHDAALKARLIALVEGMTTSPQALLDDMEKSAPNVKTRPDEREA